MSTPPPPSPNTPSMFMAERNLEQTSPSLPPPPASVSVSEVDVRGSDHTSIGVKNGVAYAYLRLTPVPHPLPHASPPPAPRPPHVFVCRVGGY